MNLFNPQTSIRDVTGAVIKTKLLDIGVWDMDATANVSVTHGLTMDNIISVSITIYNDAGNANFPLVGAYNNGTINGYYYVGSTDLYLYRVGGQLFDGVSFDDGAMNRGTIFITYKE